MTDAHAQSDFDIAVITPTYNRATLLPVALDSILAQTMNGRIEVAVVDDGSTDNTDEAIQPYLDKHGDETGKMVIRYTRLEKQGVVAARNYGIAHTTAPAIAFLDSDDYWDAAKLEKQLALLQANDKVGVVHTSFRYVNEAGELTDNGPQRVDNPCVGDCLDTLLNEFLVLFSSVMIRRSVVDAVAAAEAHGQPFDARWINSQDYDLMLRSARLCEFAYVPEPMTLYRMHVAHGAMGNLKRAFGFHCRVQLDFIERYGESIGVSEADIRERVRTFLFGRAESAFWQRQLKISQELCDLAGELDVSDDRFADLYRKASRPAWMYRIKDGVDRMLGRSGASA